MYLIDTSVWLSYLRSESSKEVDFLVNLLEKQRSFGITGVIYQEILQGAASEKDFLKLAEYFGTQKFYYPKDPVESYKEAAMLYFSCRKKGFTIRSTSDCFIAQIAIDNDLVLVHNDRDYLNIAKVNRELQLFSDL